MLNLKQFLTSNTELQTADFQKAINFCAQNGNEPLFVPFGTYYLGSLNLPSNTTIIFEDGVKIYGSKNLQDYFADEQLKNTYQDLSHGSYTKSLFYAKNAENITLKGNATIDMQSAWDLERKRSRSGRGAKVISFDNVKNVNIIDLKLLNATDVAILLGRTKNVFIRGLYMETHIDGISTDGAEDVVISDCILNCGDDALVFKSSVYDNNVCHCKRITATNCIISSMCNGIKIGTETTGDFSNINVNNCVIYNTHCTGISIESVDGSNVKGVNISNITMDNVSCPIFVYAGKRMRAPEGTPVGSINDVNIANVYADCNDKKYKTVACELEMLGENGDIVSNPSVTSNIVNMSGNPMKNINLTNITLNMVGGRKLSEIDYRDNEKGYPRGEMFGFVLPAHGLFVKNAEVTLSNVKCYVQNSDERPDIVIE